MHRRRSSAPWGLATLVALMRHLVTLVGHLSIVALALLLLWLPGLVWYAASMPERIADDGSETDAIVVLTGGSERLHAGVELLRDGRAGVLFVSGVHPGTSLDALLADEPPLPTSLHQRIVLGHVATDTVGNAIETAVWVGEQRLHSVRLVTAAYHMPRSLLEFHAAMPGVEIVAHPVFPRTVIQESWWTYPGTALLFASEYNKYLMVRLRLMLPDHPAESPSPKEK